ncbi:MAG: cytochrome-c peroxidase [Flavobacteriales bacterium]|nr:cytochrome-c peroxidase [Flavobacteriales bacterium]
MKFHVRHPLFLGLLITGLFVTCKPDKQQEEEDNGVVTTPYALVIPANFPPMTIPADNPMTVEGVTLGRFLFYEERLSGNNTQSCADCHAQVFAFSDHGSRFSTGIDGIQGNRNSMVLQNLGWEHQFFWDGRAPHLEDQILGPVENVIEMHETWPNAVAKLQADPAYVALYQAAFGSTTIDKYKTAKAIAQFVRTMISGNSRFDKFMRGEEQLTPEEQLGFLLTQQEGGDPSLGLGGQWGADCFHCHPHGGARFTDGSMRNNGLDSIFTDLGRGGVTGLPQDMGLFKVPSLRNVAVSAPYMHDGRFENLEEVIEHYNSGGHPSPTISPFMKFTQGGLSLTPEKKAQLLAFLHTLTDDEFLNNPAFQDPGPP